MFIKEVQKLNIVITSLTLTKLEQYYHLLDEANKKTNLTTITTKEMVYLKHFYDSLTLATIIPLTKIDTFCDVGSGAGFPGIVIKLFSHTLK